MPGSISGKNKKFFCLKMNRSRREQKIEARKRRKTKNDCTIRSCALSGKQTGSKPFLFVRLMREK